MNRPTLQTSSKADNVSISNTTIIMTSSKTDNVSIVAVITAIIALGLVIIFIIIAVSIVVIWKKRCNTNNEATLQGTSDNRPTLENENQDSDEPLYMYVDIDDFTEQANRFTTRDIPSHFMPPENQVETLDNPDYSVLPVPSHFDLLVQMEDDPTIIL